MQLQARCAQKGWGLCPLAGRKETPIAPSHWDRQVPADGEHVGDKGLQCCTVCSVSLCPQQHRSPDVLSMLSLGTAAFQDSADPTEELASHQDHNRMCPLYLSD